MDWPSSLEPELWLRWTHPLEPEFWMRVGFAILCGGVVGLERQLKGKPAGIRTSILICLGTVVFIQLGTLVDGKRTDPTRVLGQVISGIGFLGAGVVLTHEGLVRGVTSAAVVWILAGIGASIGLGDYGTALSIAWVTVFVLVGVQWLERIFKALRRGVHADDVDQVAGRKQ